MTEKKTGKKKGAKNVMDAVDVEKGTQETKTETSIEEAGLSFAVEKNVEMPSKFGSRKSKYNFPFDEMEVGYTQNHPQFLLRKKHN